MAEGRHFGLIRLHASAGGRLTLNLVPGTYRLTRTGLRFLNTVEGIEVLEWGVQGAQTNPVIIR